MNPNQAKNNWIFIISFLIVFFSTICNFTFGQSTVRHLSLNDAIELGLKNSHRLHASYDRILQANAQVDDAKNNRIPDMSVTGSYLRLNNPNIKMMAGNSGSPVDSSTQFPKVHQAMYALANVDFPVFTGGKIKYGIESAKYLQQAASLDAASDTQAVVLNTVEAYVNLYKSSAVVGVIKQNLAQSQLRDSILIRMENNGLLARNDRLKAQLQTSDIELSLLDAQSNHKIAMMNMDLLLGLPEQTQLITDSSEFKLPQDIQTITDLQQISLSGRKDLLALQQRQQAAQTGIKLAHTNYVPSIILTAGYAAADIPKVFRITNAVNVGIGIKYNISSLWKTKPKIDEALARYHELNEDEAQKEDDIKLQVNKSFENFLLQQKKINVFQSAVQQAEENARITKNKFDNQLLNTTDLLDANVLLLQSEINLAVGKADLYLSYTKVLQSAGILFK